MLLAIDASTRSTGFAFGGVRDRAPRGGSWDLPGCAEHVFDRTLGQAHETVGMFVRQIKAERVVIEAPLLLMGPGHSSGTMAALVQLTGAIRAAATRAGAKVSLAAVSKVRVAFIGVGNLKRDAAKRAVMDRCAQLGWHCKNDDHADANATWFYGMTQFYPAWQPAISLFAEKRA